MVFPLFNMGINSAVSIVFADDLLPERSSRQSKCSIPLAVAACRIEFGHYVDSRALKLLIRVHNHIVSPHSTATAVMATGSDTPNVTAPIAAPP